MTEYLLLPNLKMLDYFSYDNFWLQYWNNLCFIGSMHDLDFFHSDICIAELLE